MASFFELGIALMVAEVLVAGIIAFVLGSLLLLDAQTLGKAFQFLSSLLLPSSRQDFLPSYCNPPWEQGECEP